MTTAQTDAEKLNPAICKVTIGIKALREITLYPVAASGYFKMTKAISDILTAVREATNIKLMAASGEARLGDVPITAEGAEEYIKAKFNSILPKLVQENIGLLLTEATCADFEGEELLKDISLSQMADMVDAIVKMNFEGLKDTLPQKVQSWLSLFGVKELALASRSV